MKVSVRNNKYIKIIAKKPLTNLYEMNSSNWVSCRDETETVIHSDDPFAPVGYLNLRKAHLEDKHVASTVNSSMILSGP